jgi:hypothetical protein
MVSDFLGIEMVGANTIRYQKARGKGHGRRREVQGIALPAMMNHDEHDRNFWNGSFRLIANGINSNRDAGC